MAKTTKRSNVQKVRTVKRKSPTTAKRTTAKKKSCATKKTANKPGAKNKKPQDYVLMTPQGNIIAIVEHHNLV